MHKIKILLGLCALLIAGSLYAAIPVYTEKQNEIVVTANQPQFIIKLLSNRTTGYGWSLQQYDAKLVENIQHTYLPAANNLIGAPGVELWTFKLTAAGFATTKKIEIHFAYERPWEKSPIKQLVFNVIQQAISRNGGQ